MAQGLHSAPQNKWTKRLCTFSSLVVGGEEGGGGGGGENVDNLSTSLFVQVVKKGLY